jgi:uncharacterized membrane protein
MNTSEPQNTARNHTLDILRGIAIATMILSNFAGELLKAPHPIWLTILGSLAAPLFVIIAGFLVGHSVINKNYPLSYFLLRGFLTWVMAAAIDVFLWKSYPFISVDILYLAGLAIPLTAIFMRMKFSFKIILLVSCFALAPLLRNYFGYTEKPSFPPIWKEGKFIPFEGEFVVILKHWWIDGWFPIFSWLGVAFTGALLSEFRFKKPTLTKSENLFVALLGLVFILLGIVFWKEEFRLAARGNYTELFYPPTLSYYSAYLGVILLLYLLVEFSSQSWVYSPLRILGISPLFFYFLHFFIISKIIAPYFGKTPDNEVYIGLETFLITYLFILIICLTIGIMILFSKKRFPNPPFLIRFFIGG